MVRSQVSSDQQWVPLGLLIVEKEDWLAHRALGHAQRLGGVVYNSTAVGLWRARVQRLSQAIAVLWEGWQGCQARGDRADQLFEKAQQFGIEMARSFQGTGTSIQRLLGEVEAHRRAYGDWLELGQEVTEWKAIEGELRWVITRFFDRLEVGLSTEWIAVGGATNTVASTLMAALAVPLAVPLAAEEGGDDRAAIADPGRAAVQYFAVFESFPDPVLLLDRRGQTVGMNGAALRSFGARQEGGAVAPGTSPVTAGVAVRTALVLNAAAVGAVGAAAGSCKGCAVAQAIGHPATALRSLYRAHQQGTIAADGPIEVLLQTLRGPRWFDVQFVPLHCAPAIVATVAHAIALCVDITARKRSEETLQLFWQASEHSPVSIIITDAKANIQYVNPKFEQVTGYGREEVIGQNPRMLQSGEMSAADYRQMWQTLLSRQEWHGEFHNRRKDGSLFWEHASISPIYDRDGIITHYVAVKEDISVRKAQQSALEHQARYDGLTDLPNRTELGRQLRDRLTLAQRTGMAGAVLFVDLDRFKTVNDTLGHDMGDRLLQETARRLINAVRCEDVVARLGGDEFALILGPDVDRTTVQAIAQRCIGTLSAPFSLDGEEAFVGASIGIALFPQDGRNPSTLMRHADAAMYRAKQNGRNQAVFFSWDLKQAAQRRLNLENQLHHAIPRQELSLVYQPIVHLQRGADRPAAVAEALLRWNSQEGGPLSPADFIPLAEETGAIVAIGQWVLERAFKDFQMWQRRRVGPERLAVNVSPRQFREPGFVPQLETLMGIYGILPGQLELEVTEQLLIEDWPGTQETADRLDRLGIELVLDDFGTGYSSLSYLKKLKFSALKIDRSFVCGAPRDRESVSLVRAAIALARGLNLRVIAEGIESHDQATFLRREGCDYGQGYWLGRPTPATSADWLGCYPTAPAAIAAPPPCAPRDRLPRPHLVPSPPQTQASVPSPIERNA
jgi:diguanylate cyclase (GGDEF)-like protein/PAS domain S-box-containing protein